MTHTKDFNNLNKNDVAIAGGKGASLGEMTQVGIPVPPGFVVLSSAFERFLEETDLHSEIDSILHKVNHKEIHTVENASEEIQALILGAKMPKDIAAEIAKQLKALGAQYVAVRSSATAEDSSTVAWAGQLESYLNTTEKDLLQNVQKCWASLFTPRAIFYRFEKGLHDHHISVAVVVQKMIQSEVSGIAFSVHPVTRDYNQLIIEAGHGLGEVIVSGSITPDSYVVEKEPRRIIDKNIQTKKSVLSDSEIVKLSELILKIESHFGFPCDIEWVLEKGKFYIVQSRPITTLRNLTPREESSRLEGMILIAKRQTNPFEASLRIKSWSEGLKKELGIGYKKIIINSDGEYYVDSESENKIANILKSKKVKDAMNYIGMMYELRDRTLKKVKEKGDKLDEDFTDLFTYFFIARRIAENVYEKVSPKDKKTIENWRNDTKLFKPLDLFCELQPQDNSRENWSVVFNDGQLKIIDEKLNRLQQKAELRPTVKRDLSLFSVQAWQKGYLDYLEKRLGWRYPILLYYDGQKVNFYHKMEDFKYFKEIITAKVISDDKLFKKLNKDFLDDIKKLKFIRKVTAKNLSEIFELIASSMSFYIFVVSDSFVKERPEAWKSRHFSEGILYLMDEKIELYLEESLKKHKLAPRLAHFLNRDEALKLANREEINMEIVKKRIHNYLLEEKDIITSEDFSEYCERKLYINPETETSKTQKSEIRGSVAYRGKAKGLVRIVANRKDLDKVRKGDILVAPMTNVNYFLALKKASAFITDEGGVTCHAAIIARELKKPCIIGTKIATQVLKDRDLVEVDADEGIVRILK